MRKWDEFGEQVNRLVYALAGRKYQADIERANRAIAEAICYSEVSVRMMRQGRFHPRELRAMETLVEIGREEAELGRDWAARLLRSGEHPAVDLVLARIYPPDDQAAVIMLEKQPSPFLPRMVGAFLATLIMLVIWTYGLQPVYPAPHELPWVRELLWGGLLGVGLAIGVFAADRLRNRGQKTDAVLAWWRYGLLIAGGLLGAVVWKLVASGFNPVYPAQGLESSWLETAFFGASYGLSFSLALILARGKYCAPPFPRRWQLAAGGTVLCACLCLAGYFMVVLQPSFASQKDVDMAVGILLRVGLVLLSAYTFPQ